MFHIINTEGLTASAGQISKKSIKIGRGADSDVRVTEDISVSRNHAFIHRDGNGHYYLLDNKSKFGTLMQLQYPVFLSVKNFAASFGQSLVIQSGKTLLNLRVRKTQSCMERYSCLRACSSCFSRSRKETVTNLITLDGLNHFPREFLDLKAFNSNRGHAIIDKDSEEEEVENKTAHGAESNAVRQSVVRNEGNEN